MMKRTVSLRSTVCKDSEAVTKVPPSFFMHFLQISVVLCILVRACMPTNGGEFTDLFVSL